MRHQKVADRSRDWERFYSQFRRRRQVLIIAETSQVPLAVSNCCCTPLFVLPRLAYRARDKAYRGRYSCVATHHSAYGTRGLSLHHPRKNVRRNNNRWHEANGSSRLELASALRPVVARVMVFAELHDNRDGREEIPWGGRQAPHDPSRYGRVAR